MKHRIRHMKPDCSWESIGSLQQKNSSWFADTELLLRLAKGMEDGESRLAIAVHRNLEEWERVMDEALNRSPNQRCWMKEPVPEEPEPLPTRTFEVEGSVSDLKKVGVKSVVRPDGSVDLVLNTDGLPNLPRWKP